MPMSNSDVDSGTSALLGAKEAGAKEAGRRRPARKRLRGRAARALKGRRGA